MERIAVIGAGVAGLACARSLAEAGHHVVVFDKGRGIGGRMATRRAGEIRFDHGAVALVPRGGAFGAFLGAAAVRGHAARWPAAGGWTGVPGMRGLIMPLAEGLDITSGAEVTGLSRAAGGWHLSGALIPDMHFDRVVLATPQPQAARLLAPWPGLVARMAHVSMQPCWTLMAGFDASIGDGPDIARFDGGPLALIAHENTKPGRNLRGEAWPEDAWVVQANADWSRQHLEEEQPQVQARLLAAFFAAIGQAPVTPTTLMAHRWRYALTDVPLGQSHLLDAALGIGLCGDWCLGARAEDAFDSGQALAAAMLQG